MEIDPFEILAGKWEDGTRPKDLFAEHVRNDPERYVEEIVRGLSSGSRRVENGCAELASLLSEEHPEKLYPHVNIFVDKLRSKEKMMRWEAVCTLGNLARVDDDERVPPCLSTMTSFLRDKSIVLQGHAVRALAKTAAAYPALAPKIFDELTGAADCFPGNKVGFIVEALEHLIGIEGLKVAILRFVEPHAGSEIKVVARKATKVLKRLEKVK